MSKRAVVGERQTVEVPAKLSLSVTEAAELLGFTEKRLRHLIAHRRFPYRRAGSRIVILRAELQRWLDGSLPGVSLEEVERRLA